MAAILFPLTDDMAGALRATLNTRLYEVERLLRVIDAELAQPPHFSPEQLLTTAPERVA